MFSGTLAVKMIQYCALNGGDKFKPKIYLFL